MVLSIALLGKYVHFPLSFFFCMISSVCIVMESTVINAVIWEQKKKKNAYKIFVIAAKCMSMYGDYFFWYLHLY